MAKPEDVKELPGVALFIDWENLEISLRQCLNMRPSMTALRKFAERYGRLLVARAYADWRNHGNASESLFREGFAPVYAMSRKAGGETKNSADIMLAVECCQSGLTNPLVKTIVVVSGDMALTHLIPEARRTGRRIIFLGLRQTSSSLVTYLPDEFVAYEDLISGYVPQAAQKLDSSTQRKRKDEISQAFSVVEEVVRELRTADEAGRFPEHDALAFKQALLVRLPGFKEEDLGFETFRHFIFAAELEGKLIGESREEYPLVYRCDESKSDGGKLLIGGKKWKELAEAFGRMRAPDGFEPVVLAVAKENGFLWSPPNNPSMSILSPHDVRAAVYKMAAQP